MKIGLPAQLIYPTLSVARQSRHATRPAPNPSNLSIQPRDERKPT